MAVSSFATSSTTPVVKEQIFNSSGSWVKPAGVKSIQVIACGGGGGVSQANTVDFIGGNAAFFNGSIDISTKPTGYSMPIVIGAGGGVTASGGTTTVDSTIIVPGGVTASSGAVQPDSGRLDPSSTELLTITQAGVYGAESGNNSQYFYKGYYFNINRYVNSGSTFSITTTRPSGTSVTFSAPSNSTIYNYSHHWGNYGPPSIAADGLGSIYISGFYRPSDNANYATAVSRDDGATWALYDASALNTIINGSAANIMLNFWIQNGVWFASSRGPSAMETGTILAYSLDGVTWSGTGAGSLNNGSANNQGFVNYGGTFIAGILFDAAAQVWYVHRWGRSGYYRVEHYVHKSSGPNLATATWTRMFYSTVEWGGDLTSSFWLYGMGVNTLAKLADGTFIISMTARNGDSIGAMDIPFTSSTSGALTNGVFTNHTYASLGMTYPLGFNTKFQRHLYHAYRSDSGGGVGMSNAISASTLGIFSSSTPNLQLPSITLGDDENKSIYIYNATSYLLYKLLKAVKQYGDKQRDTDAGNGGVGGFIKRVGGASGQAVYAAPPRNPYNMCMPSASNSTFGLRFIYDATYPGTGGYYASSTDLRNGNPGQVIIRWTE